MKKTALLAGMLLLVWSMVWGGGFDVELLPVHDVSLEIGISSGRLDWHSDGDDVFTSKFSLTHRYVHTQPQTDLYWDSSTQIALGYDSSEQSSFFSFDLFDSFVHTQQFSGDYYFGTSGFSPAVGFFGEFEYKNIPSDSGAQDEGFYIGAAPFFGAGRLLRASDYVQTYLTVKGLGVQYLARTDYTRIASFSARRAEYIMPFSWSVDMEYYRAIERTLPGMFESIDVKYMMDSIVDTGNIYQGFRVGLYPKFWLKTDPAGTWEAFAHMVYLDAAAAGPIHPKLWYKGGIKLYDSSLEAPGNSLGDIFSELTDAWFDLDDIDIQTDLGAAWFLSRRYRLDYELSLWFFDVFNDGVSSFKINNNYRLACKFGANASGYISVTTTGETDALSIILPDRIQASWGIELKLM